MKISVIISVYNGKDCLEAAVHSVQAQSMSGWELILVNDGSTDATGAICDRLAKEDERIRVVHTPNYGQGIARNTGLSMARGKFVWFVDADDTLEPGGMKQLWETAEKNGCDVAAALYYRVENKKKLLVQGSYDEGIVDPGGTAGQRERFHRMKSESIFGYLWNKLYRREFLNHHGLKLDDIREIYMEDQLFNLKVISKRPVYYLSEKPVYNYHVRNSSTTRRADSAIASKNKAMLDAYYKYLKEERLTEENMDLLTALAARVFCFSLVKNIPYEGLKYGKIRRRMQEFLDSEGFMAAVLHKKCFYYLRKLPRLPERAGYCGIFFLLRLRAFGLICFLLVCSYPVLKWYISKNVK